MPHALFSSTPQDAEKRDEKPVLFAEGVRVFLVSELSVHPGADFIRRVHGADPDSLGICYREMELGRFGVRQGHLPLLREPEGSQGLHQVRQRAAEMHALAGRRGRQLGEARPRPEPDGGRHEAAPEGVLPDLVDEPSSPGSGVRLARSSRASARSSVSDYEDEDVLAEDDIRIAGESISEVEDVSNVAMADLRAIAECMIPPVTPRSA
ncbi:hypothetical protein C3L33_20251, partial [Rhododendron williamsianum]